MADLFNLRVFARNLLRGNHRRNIFHFSFFDDRSGIRTQAFADILLTRPRRLISIIGSGAYFLLWKTRTEHFTPIAGLLYRVSSGNNGHLFFPLNGSYDAPLLLSTSAWIQTC